jgi:cysteine-rich repeat protein
MRNHHIATRVLLTAVGALPLGFLACGGTATGLIGADGGSDAPVQTDGTTPRDTGTKDTGTKDTGTKDTGAKDTGTKDTGIKDGGSGDTGAGDTGPGDTGAGDTGAGDTGAGDTGPGDTGAADTGPGDTGAKDAGEDTAKTDAGAVCGNGTIEGTEQCDDGNLLDLDGCDSKCHYEMVTRMTTISISGSAGPSFCIHKGNALGSKALTTTALGQLNPDLETDVTNGTVNVFTQFLALSDLTGTTATGFTIGVLDGNLDPAKGTWPTAGNPIDWWYLADPTAVSAGLPTGLLTTGALAAHVLTAGPSTVTLALNLGGSPADLSMLNAKIDGTIANATDVPAPPPTKLATGLEVFETIAGNGTGQGLCGDITVQSLAQIPVPSVLTTGTTKCTEDYTYCGAGNPVSATCNSLLDVLVGGCNITVIVTIPVVNATQPDVPPVGGTAVTNLTVGTNKKVTIPTAAETEAYSSYLQFAANRGHFTGEYCTATAECQTGQTCTGTDGTDKICAPQ